MSKTSTYLNFTNQTEEAFNFYRSVFGGEFIGQFMRLGDMPAQEGVPALSEADKKLIMHVELPILGGHVLMGTDAPESMNFKIVQGNNVYINLEPDTRAEADRLFAMLSEGGKIETKMQEMFWGGYYGSLADKFRVQCMINCAAK